MFKYSIQNMWDDIKSSNVTIIEVLFARKIRERMDTKKKKVKTFSFSESSN